MSGSTNIKHNKSFFSSVVPIIFLALMVLILGACDETGVDASGDLSDYPESVQDGTVSVEYYEQISNFYRDSRPTIDLLADLVDNQLSDKRIIYNEEYTAKLSDVLQGFDDILITYEVAPSTKDDEEIHAHLERVLYFQLQLNEMQATYINTKDDSMTTGVKSTLAILMNVVEDLDTATHEYGLIEE